MRTHTLMILALAPVGCSPVEAVGDASPGTIDSATVDGTPGDGAIDAPMIDAPTGPTPRLRWSFDGNLDNTGSVSGVTLSAPAGISYGAGKIGQAGAFGGGQYSLATGVRAVLGSYPKVTIAFWLKEPGTLQSTSVVDCINRSTSPYGGIQLGFAGTSGALCVATTTSSLLGGGCGGITSPSVNSWHHWIIRYDGAGLGTGQGGDTTVWVDGVLAATQVNDNAKNPVFTSSIPDALYLGAPTTQLDDVRVYDQVFTPAEQCTFLVGGTVAGATCTLP